MRNLAAGLGIARNRAAASKREVPPSAFTLGNFRLHVDSIKVEERPLTLSGDLSPWAYIASWENELPVHAAVGSGLRIEAELAVEAGRLELGVVAADFSTFIDRVELGQGQHRVVLEAPDAAAARAVVLRNREDAASVGIVLGRLGGHLVDKGKARERGFLAKSAVEDLREKIGRDNPVVIDVGANVGDMVARFLEAFPRATVLAMEPHPQTFDRLRHRFAAMAQVRPRNAGVSGKGGTATLHAFTNPAINALSPVAAGAGQLMDGQIEPLAQVPVTLQTLGDILREEKLEAVDILKLDTQGHEAEILAGALEELSSGKVRYVLTELIFSSLYKEQSRAGDVISILERCGFKLFDFYDFVYHEDQGLKWGDALFEFVGPR